MSSNITELLEARRQFLHVTRQTFLTRVRDCYNELKSIHKSDWDTENVTHAILSSRCPDTVLMDAIDIAVDTSRMPMFGYVISRLMRQSIVKGVYTIHPSITRLFRNTATLDDLKDVCDLQSSATED
jgi:hypothetical protein